MNGQRWGRELRAEASLAQEHVPPSTSGRGGFDLIFVCRQPSKYVMIEGEQRSKMSRSSILLSCPSSPDEPAF